MTGSSKLTPGTTYIFVANHSSHYDTPVVFTHIPYQVRIIAKQSLAMFPVLGWHLKRGGHLFVDRRGSRSRGHPEALARARLAGPLADRLSGRHADARRPRRAVQGGKLSAGDSGGPADRAAVDHRHPQRDAERTAAHRACARHPRRARSDSAAGHRGTDRARRQGARRSRPRYRGRSDRTCPSKSFTADRVAAFRLARHH